MAQQNHDDELWLDTHLKLPLYWLKSWLNTVFPHCAMAPGAMVATAMATSTRALPLNTRCEEVMLTALLDSFDFWGDALPAVVLPRLILASLKRC